MPLTRPTTPEEAEERLKSAFVLDDFGDVGGEVEDFPIPDKKAFLKTSATSAWAQGVIGSTVSPYQVGWQGQKDGIARSYFGEKDASGVSDEQLFSKIAEDYKAKDALAEAARNAAARGESWLGKFREVEQTMPNVAGGRQSSYLGLAREVHDKFREKILTYQSIIRSVAEKAKSIETSPEGMDWSGMAQELIQVPKESRPFVLEAISRQAAANIDADAASRLGKEFARGFERFLDTAMSGSYNVLAAAGQYSEIPLAPETPQEIEARKARESQDADLMDLRDDIRDISTGKLAKLEDVRVLGMNISGAARNVPMTIGAFVPYIGPAALVGSFQRETANELRRANPTMSRDDIETIATISAPFQAVTEVVSDRLLFGKLPNLKRLFTTPAFSAGGIAAQLAGRAALGTATEYAEEFAQGVIPKLVQSLKSDVPDVDWDGYFQDFKDQSPELLATILPLALFGAGVGQATDYRASVQMLYSADEMMAAKIPADEARKIAELATAGKRPEAESMFRQEFRKAATKGEAPAEMRAAAQRVIAANQAQRQVEEINSTEAANLGVRVFRDSQGWKVETAGGNVINADSAEASRRIRDDIRTASTEYEAETMTALVDDMVALQPQMRVELRPEVATATSEGIEFTDPVTGKTTKMGDAKSFQNLRDQAEAISGNQAESARLILGDNYFEFGEGIARVFRRARGPEAVPQVITAAHEVIESSFRRGLLAGQWTENDARNAIGSLLPALESGVAKLGKKATAEERLWLDNAKRAVAEGDSNLVREVISEMGVRTWIGRDRDGNKTGLRPGTILRALDAAILQEKSPENVTTYQRLRAWFKAVGAYLKGVVATAKIIRDAERNGTIDDFTGFLDKVLGIEAATREELEVKAGVQNMAFSLAPELKNAQLGMSEAEISRYDEAEKLRQEAVKTAEAELAKLKEKRTTGVSWDEAYSDPEEGGVDPVPDGKTANHWTLAPPKDFQNPDRLYYDIGEYEKGTVFSVTKSRKGNGDTWGEFPSLAEAKAAAEADFIQEAGEEWTGVFGSNLDSQEAIKPIFDHFALPDGVEFERDTAWGVTKWGSWYAHVKGYDQKRGEVRTLKLSVRDHDATRKDMGLPDLTAEVSKSWTPQEVADALKRMELKVWKRLSSIEERDVQNMAFSLAPELRKPDFTEFEAKLEELQTLDLEEDQFNMPRFNPERDNLVETLIAGEAHLMVRGKDEISPYGAHELFIVDNDDAPIGFVRLTKSPEQISINMIHINEDYRGRGIGSEFYRYWLDKGVSVKSDKEITDSTAAVYMKLAKEGYAASVEDGRAVLRGKPVGSTFSLAPTEQDREYLAAVESGDMAKAQSMVDEAAKAAGYNVGPVFHGTNQDFTKFSKNRIGKNTKAASSIAFFFTDTKDEAQEYADLAARTQVTNSVAIERDSAKLRKKIAAAENSGNWDMAERLYLELENLELGALYEGEIGQRILTVYLKSNNPKTIDLKDSFDGHLVAAEIKKAKRKGFDSLLLKNSYDPVGKRDAAFSTNQTVIFDPNQIKSAEPVTRDDAGNIIPLSQRFNTETPDIRYSLSPQSGIDIVSDTLESWQDVFDKAAKRNPARAMAIRDLAQQRINKLGEMWAADRWTANGDKIRAVVEKRTKGSLDDEQAMREALRYQELLDVGMDTLTPETLMAYSEGVGTLEDDPLVKKMLHENGRLMSWATASRQNRDIKDQYNDAPWIPPQWYSGGKTVSTAIVTFEDGSMGSYDAAKVPAEVKASIAQGKATIKINKTRTPPTGGIMPDVMANNLGFDKASEMWAALESSIKSHRSAKEGYAKAEAAVKAVDNQAREQAKTEAAAWRQEADDMQADDWSPRESLVRDMRVLNVALSAFPPEVRAKVTGGSMVKLAGLATERARYKAIKKALDRAIVETEKFMRKEYTAQVKAVFARYEPDAKSGEKPKGKLGPDVQEIYDAAKAALGLSAEQTQAELARLDSLISADGITPEQELNLTRQRGLVELMGDWKNADSGRMAAALEALEDTLSEGWASWKLRQILIREGREESRKELRSATKKKGLGKERDDMRDEAATTLGKASSALLNLSSFSDVMKYAFGVVNKAKEFINRERIASNAYEDAIQVIGDRVQDFFTAMGGGSVIAGERIRYDLAHSRVKVGSGDSERNLTQMQGIQALLMWQQEDGRRHMEGPKDENGAPIEGKWSYDETWITDLESKLTPEAKSVKLFLQQLYSEEWAPLNAIYRDIHGINLPRHDLYAPLTVKPQQAKAGEMVDPVSGAAIAGSILTPGSLRSRNRTAQAEPDFRDALAVFLGHSRQMEHWKNYYQLAVDLSAVLGNREVMNAVEASIGGEGVTVLRKWIDAIAQGGFRDAAAQMEISQIMSRVAGRAATVALLGRVSTLLVQSTQLAAASVRMPVGAYLKRLGKLTTGNLSWGDAIKSDFIQRRIKQAPPIIRQAMNDLGTASRPNAITSSVRYLGNLLSGADGLFTGGTYAILLDWHRTQGAKMGLEGAGLDAYAHDMAATITEEVAQPVRMANRSLMELTSTNPLAKVSWAYSSEARQKIALFFWSAKTAKADPTKFGKTAFLTFIVGGLVSQVLKNLWREAKGDDDEKKWSVERLTTATLAGPLHGIPMASEIMGNPGQLSSIAWSKAALEDVLTGDADMQDVQTLLSVSGYFNDNLAGIGALGNLGFDFAKIIKAATEGD